MEFISACTLDCPDGCSTIIAVDDNGKRSIKGNPDHPFTQGFTCPKAQHGLERISSPNRITTPLMRKNGELCQVSWNEALSTIENKIAALKNTPERMLHLRGYGFHGVLADAGKYFFNTLGASSTEGALCDNAIIDGCIADFGSLDQNDYTELLNAGCIINWGRDIIRSSIHTTKIRV